MSPPTKSRLASTKTIISALGTVAATAMVVRTISQDYLPSEIQDYLSSGFKKFIRHFSSEVTMVINEYAGYENNSIYDAAVVYLGFKVSTNTRRLRVTKPEEENNFSLSMEYNEEVIDVFNDVQFKWTWLREVRPPKHNHLNLHSRSEYRYFELSFHSKHTEEALNCYLPFILKAAKDLKQANRTLKIFTIDTDDNDWESVNLDHPSTFETLAMDEELKETVIRDLDMFVKRREKYRKIGKAWKRGYLLYGPPGTGKSSLIAAMANHLKFNIYDLELTDLKCNSELRKLLIETENRSILVVEDIDCSIELHERASAAKADKPADKKSKGQKSKVTLSGFLNFIDGLWSSCGDERIIVFTTNHKEKLDPALLRPGRMDMHIHMSYCTPCGFRILAKNYLDVKDHKLFGEIEDLIRTTEVTPAEVAEQLLKSDDPDVSLASLIRFLHTKRKECEEAEKRAKEKKAAEEVAESVAHEDGDDDDDKDNENDDEDDNSDDEDESKDD